MLIINGSTFSKIILNQYKKKILKDFINRNFRKKYYSSILAVFKNEGHIIREWVQHYRKRGIEKIFLINDNSTDNFYSEIEDFIKEGYVTLKNVDKKDNVQDPGRQELLYNKYFHNIIDKTEWVGVLDLDEFVYSPDNTNINDILRKYDNQDIQELIIDWYWFGSNGFKQQPNKVVDNFIKRGKYLSREYNVGPSYTSFHTCKCFMKTKILYSFGIHHSNFSYNKGIFRSEGQNFDGFNVRCSDKNELFINHYNIQSEEAYKRKILKGSCNNTPQMKKSMELFKLLDLNDVEDLRLKNQNNTKTKIAIIQNTNFNFEVAICLYETLSKYDELDVGIFIIDCDSDKLDLIKKYNINLLDIEQTSNFDVGICVSSNVIIKDKIETVPNNNHQIFNKFKKIVYISHKFDDFNLYKKEINTTNCLCLSPYSKKVGIDYILPLEIPIKTIRKNISDLDLVIQNNFEPKHLEFLNSITSNFKINFLRNDFDSKKFKFNCNILNNLKEIEFYEHIKNCNFILCMKNKSPLNFLHALCFEKPIFCHEKFEKIYNLPGIYYNENNAQNKFEELLSITEDKYFKLVDSYKELKEKLKYKNKRRILQKIYY